jgi:hypothetical protein
MIPGVFPYDVAAIKADEEGVLMYTIEHRMFLSEDMEVSHNLIL